MSLDDGNLLPALEPVAAQLVDRHLSQAREWFPHELVPWGRGRDFEEGWTWSPEEATVPAEVRSSLFVNLLTEDNLPYYFRTIESRFGRDSAWGEWSRRWTAEEGRHSIVIRDYLVVTRAVDPVELERARMAQVSRGEVPEPETIEESIIYVALQELATRIAHRNTGVLLEDPAGYEVMKRVAVDENFHHLFYRDLCAAAFEIDPSRMVVALDRQVRGFAMPGTGIPDFDRHARLIASAGIYDLQVHHDAILEPVVIAQWKVDELTGLSAEAEAARESLFKHMRRVKKAGDRMARSREEKQALAAAGT